MSVIRQFSQHSMQYFSGWGWQAGRHFFDDWHWGEIAWLAGATVVICLVSWWSHHSWMVFIASLTGIWNNILIAKGKVVNFLFGVVNNVLYAWISLSSGVYGQCVLFMGYFLPMQFYGWFLWIRPSNQEESHIVTYKMSWTQRIKVISLIIVATLLYALLLYALGEAVAVEDALATVLSVIAMWLMARLYIEQWWCWIVINIVSVLLWLQMVIGQGSQNDALVAMWLVFLGNAVYGFVHWLKLYRGGRH